MSLLDTVRREMKEAPVRHVRQSSGTLIFDIHQRGNDGVYGGVRSLRFNATNGYWEEHGKLVHQLSRTDIAFLQSAAPWTVARYS